MPPTVVQAPEGRLTIENIPLVYDTLQSAVSGASSVELDLSQVVEVDSAGAALLGDLARRVQVRGGAISVTNLSPEVSSTLALFPFVDTQPEPRIPEGMVERVGGMGFSLRNLAEEYLYLLADLAWFCTVGLFQRRGVRWQVVITEMAAMGSRALGVVGLIAFLVGGTIALQSAAQLRQFGANIFLADLVGVSIVRELGPLMAAIVVAGRSGSAVAAELATMTITEEVDAVRTMGLNPTRFLVLPKFMAITITQPVLTAFANILGIFGGFLVAITYLDVGPSAFLNRLQQAVMLKDVVTGLIKSIIFAQLIVTIGALLGLRTRGGADEVGRTTTMSVVASIFAVIVADAFASLVFYFGE